MDVKPAAAKRSHFRRIVGTTPYMIVGEGAKHALVIISDAACQIGTSGSFANGTYMDLPANTGFTDNYTVDEWWVRYASGSGTVSGFVAS